METKEDPIVRIVRLMLGEVAAKIFEHLYKNTSEIRDDEIAEALDFKLNSVRRNLYLLSEHGLVTYRRVRSKETGWYMYYWKINRESVQSIINARKHMVLKKLKERLAYEENNAFYICPLDGSRYTFDEALENEFKCSRCGAGLVYYDNADIVNYLKERIRKLEKSLKQKSS